MSQRSLFSLIITAIFFLAGCESTSSIEENPDTKSYYEVHTSDTVASSALSPTSHRDHALFKYFEEWKGTPYRLGGASKKGIDCSAFTQQAYATVFEHMLPRTTRQQLTEGNKINLSNAGHGDLIFFKTGRTRYHVGIYIGEKQFMHASTSKGVTISRVDNPYWSKRIIQVRRYPRK